MIGHRLQLARKSSGLSLRDLCDALGGNPGERAISAFEKDEAIPDSDVLLRLCNALDVSAEFLMSCRISKLEGIEFRKSASTSAKDRARVAGDVIDQIDRYLNIEILLEIDPNRWTPPFPLERLANEADAEETAARLRLAWDLGIDPIPDLTELLEERGLKVLAVPLPNSVSGLTCWAIRSKDRGRLPTIVVNRKHGLERRRFTLAHELAHRVLDAEALNKPERAADRFAGAFLVPGSHLRERVSSKLHPERRQISYGEIIRLKRFYRVSAATILMRLGQIGVLEPSAVRLAFQSFARHWRRSEPDPIEAIDGHLLEMPRRFERLCYWALAERQVSPHRAANLLGVSMTEIEAALRGPLQAKC